MLINGKERKFLLTVGAYEDIEKICPNAEIGRMGELLEGKNLMRNLIDFALILNHAYEETITPEGEPVDSVTRRELRALRSFDELMEEVTAAIDEGEETTVDIEFKKNAEAEAAVS